MASSVMNKAETVTRLVLQNLPFWFVESLVTRETQGNACSLNETTFKMKFGLPKTIVNKLIVCFKWIIKDLLVYAIKQLLSTQPN